MSTMQYAFENAGKIRINKSANNNQVNSLAIGTEKTNLPLLNAREKAWIINRHKACHGIDATSKLFKAIFNTY